MISQQWEKQGEWGKKSPKILVPTLSGLISKYLTIPSASEIEASILAWERTLSKDGQL